MPASVVLVAGSLHYDIMVEAEDLPKVDETAVGKRWYPKFGGKGGNQAVSVARQGVSARMVGAVGDDSFGQFLKAQLHSARVDDRFVRVAPGVGSGMSVAIMDARGDYAAAIVSGANLTIGAADLEAAEVWQDVGILVLQNEMPEGANIAAASEARRRGIRTLLNAAPYRPLAPELSAMVDILVVNAVEAEMSGCDPIRSLDDADVAARALGQRFGTVIVTAGALGLAASDTGNPPFALAAETVRVVSSHGAGDSFIGALAAALVRGDPMETASRAASSAAARHVAGLG